MKTKLSNSKFVRVIGLTLSLLIILWGVAPFSFADEAVLAGGPFPDPVIPPSEGAFSVPVDSSQINPKPADPVAGGDLTLLDNSNGTLSPATDPNSTIDPEVLQALAGEGLLTLPVAGDPTSLNNSDVTLTLEELQTLFEQINADSADGAASDPNALDLTGIDQTGLTPEDLQTLQDPSQADLTNAETNVLFDEVSQEVNNSQPIVNVQNETAFTPEQLAEIEQILHEEDPTLTQEEIQAALNDIQANVNLTVQEQAAIDEAALLEAGPVQPVTPPVEAQTVTPTSTPTPTPNNSEGSFAQSNGPSPVVANEGAIGSNQNTNANPPLPYNTNTSQQAAANSGGGGGGGGGSSSSSSPSGYSGNSLGSGLGPTPSLPGALGSGIPTLLTTRVNRLRVKLNDLLAAVERGERSEFLLFELHQALDQLLEIQATYDELKMKIHENISALILRAKEGINAFEKGQSIQVEAPEKSEVDLAAAQNEIRERLSLEAKPQEKKVVNDEMIPDQALVATVNLSDQQPVSPQFDN